MGKLTGKTAIITGASGGLGKQIALRFANEGANVAICARNKDKLLITKKLCEDAGANVLAMTADVTKKVELDRFVQKVVDQFAGIDILVNNAATINAPHPFMEHTVEDLDEAIQSGLYGTWHMMQLCYPYLSKNGGSVINFGSIGGVMGMEGFAAYAAEKEAIRALSRVAAREWGVQNIRVNCICPNVVTDRFEEGIQYAPPDVRAYLEASMTNNVMKRKGDPYEDATPAVVFLASEDSRWITGQTLHVEGGMWISP